MMICLLLSQRSLASVDLQTGAWNWNFHIQGLEVSYSSRSLHHGWWGQGWCSPLDVTLQKKNGTLQIERCSVSENTLIESKPDGHFASKIEGWSYEFNEDLKIIRAEKDQNKIWIQWHKNEPVWIQINSENFLVSLNSQNQILALKSLNSQNLDSEFQYSKGRLVSISTPKDSAPSFRTVFKYDSLDNLVQIQTPDLKVSIAYNQKDQVQEVLANSNCKTQYRFHSIEQKSTLVQVSSFQQTCKKNPSVKIKRSLFTKYQIRSGGHLDLISVKETTL